jgi:hypothetical protein
MERLSALRPPIGAPLTPTLMAFRCRSGHAHARRCRLRTRASDRRTLGRFRLSGAVPPLPASPDTATCLPRCAPRLEYLVSLNRECRGHALAPCVKGMPFAGAGGARLFVFSRALDPPAPAPSQNSPARARMANLACAPRCAPRSASPSHFDLLNT